MCNSNSEISHLAQDLAKQVQSGDMTTAEIAAKFQMLYVLGLGKLAEDSKAAISQEPGTSLLAQFEYMVQTLAVISIYRCLSKALPSINQVPTEFQEDISGMQQGCINVEAAAVQCEEALAVLRKVL